MARNFDSSSNEYLAASAPPAVAVPLTMSCFMRRSTSSGSRTLVALDRTTAIDRFRLGIDGSNRLFAQTANSSISKTAIHPTATTLNQWHHACAVFPSNSLRRIYTDGGTPTTESSTLTPSGINGAHVGALREGGLGMTRFFGGDIAGIAIWSAALTDSEIGWLALGMSPLSLTHRLGNLVMHQDLIRSLNRPGVGPSVSAAGSSVVKHPRTILWGGPPIVGMSRNSIVYLRLSNAEAVTSGLLNGKNFVPGVKGGQPWLPGAITSEVLC